MAPPATAKQKCEWLGIEAMVEAIEGGKSLRDLARQLLISPSSLKEWIDSDPERSRASAAARKVSAEFWDGEAEREIKAAKSKLGLAKARELASHYRWRSKAIDPKTYGEKVGVEHSGTVELASALEAARKRVGGDER